MQGAAVQPHIFWPPITPTSDCRVALTGMLDKEALRAGCRLGYTGTRMVGRHHTPGAPSVWPGMGCHSCRVEYQLRNVVTVRSD